MTDGQGWGEGGVLKYTNKNETGDKGGVGGGEGERTRNKNGQEKSEGLGDKHFQRVNLTFTHLYAISICQSQCVKDGPRSWRHVSESNIPFWR